MIYESTTSSFKIQLSLDRAISDLNIVNIEPLLKMDSKTKLEIKESDFADFQVSNIPTNEELTLENRKDLEFSERKKAVWQCSNC
jgi:hypothetical protein